MKQDESQGYLKPSYVLGPVHLPVPGEVRFSEEGAKRNKTSNKNHHSNHQHTV